MLERWWSQHMNSLVGHWRVFVFSEWGGCHGKVLSRGGTRYDLVPSGCMWRMDYGWWEWRWETRGESTSVIQVGDGWTMLVAVVEDAFYENCLFTSLVHFQLGSCFRIICQGFLYYVGYLCHLFGVLVGLWCYEMSPPSARDLAFHRLAEKAQEGRGLCTVVFPAQAPILPQPQRPVSILPLGLWTRHLA